MPKSDILTKLQEQDEKVLKLLGQQKQLAHSTLRSGEHIKKKLRVYIQSEHANQGPSREHSAGSQAGNYNCKLWLYYLPSTVDLPFCVSVLDRQSDFQ